MLSVDGLHRRNIFCAAANGELVKLQEGLANFNVNTPDYYGDTLLHIAAQLTVKL